MSIQFPSVNDLPVIAGMPDPLIGANGKQITGVASEQSFTAAQPVYAWLKVPSNIGFNYRPGGHMLAPDDWSAILDFADLHFRSIKTDRSFDTLPAPDQFH